MNIKNTYNVAVVGATGAVGQEMIKMLEKRKFPVNTLLPLASANSKGRHIEFRRKKIDVSVLDENSFKDIDIALFSAGGSVSLKYAPLAAKDGAVVIDNTSAFRMNKQVPLVVPEVNRSDICTHKGIIANPNCSTIQMVLALYPIHKKYIIKRVVVSTYQSVSGAGAKGMHALMDETMLKLSGSKIKNKVLGDQIAFNLIPQIDVFLDNGSTKEEIKMANETKKIMHDETIQVCATCVRVPILRCHSESVNIETEKGFQIESIREILSSVDNLKVMDDTAHKVYPTPIFAENKTDTFVGRIRKDASIKNGLNMWIVSDNLLKGAAFNAVQIAEELIKGK